MPSVDRKTYDHLQAELGDELQRAALRFSQKHGWAWNGDAYLRQSSYHGETAREALTFGMNVWPEDDAHYDNRTVISG